MNTIKCHICYQLSFNDWIEYHSHYLMHHMTNLSGKIGVAEAIRQQAIKTPKNVTGRTKAQIVAECEADNARLLPFLVQ